MRDGLRPLLEAIRERGTPPDTSVLQGTFDPKAQADLCNDIAKELGFNLDCGRLDVSVHPFTGGAVPAPSFFLFSLKQANVLMRLNGHVWFNQNP